VRGASQNLKPYLEQSSEGKKGNSIANRLFYQFRLALEKQIVDLYANFTIGAAGAPTLVVAKSKGIASVTRLGAGQYSIVLQDSYYDMLMATGTILSAAAPAAPGFRVISQAVANAASKAIVVQFSNAAGVATDPANGEAILFHVQLKQSAAY